MERPTPKAPATDAKADLRLYLQAAREALLWLDDDAEPWWRDYRGRVEKAALEATGRA